jgi:hypothetical protein
VDRLELETLCNTEELEVYSLLTELLQAYKDKPSYSRLMERGTQFFASHFNLNPSTIMSYMVEGLDIAVITGEQLRSVVPQLQAAGLLQSSGAQPKPLPEMQRSNGQLPRMVELAEKYKAEGRTFRKKTLAREVVLEFHPELKDIPGELESKTDSLRSHYNQYTRPK